MSIFEAQNTKQRIVAMLVVTLLLYTGYQLSNRFHVLAPSYLPLTFFDTSVPFLLWTVWPYFLLIFMAFLPIYINDVHLFRRTMLAFIIAVTCNIMVWIFAPTVYVRPPLPEEGGLTSFAYSWLCSIDTPANCLPSGHITSPLIGSWALAKYSPKYKWGIWFSFFLLSISIFTTKQHYIWDMPAGIFTASLGIFLSNKITRQQNA